MKKKKVITLCGSTKFKRQFEEVNAKFTMAGNVVISVGVFGHANKVEFTEGQKEQLDKIHLQKIDMADEIFVINVGGYIGSSTLNEIKYAKSKGKPVRYLEELGGKAKSSRRNLIVVEHKETGERFLYSPFKYKKVIPEGFYKITQLMPLDEGKYGHLPELIGELIEKRNLI